MYPRADASIGPHRVNVFFIIAHHSSAGQIYTPVPVCFFQKRRLTKHLSVDILGVQTAMLCKVYGIGQRKKGGDRYETLPALQFAYHPARPQDLPGLRQSAVRPNRRGTAQATPMGARGAALRRGGGGRVLCPAQARHPARRHSGPGRDHTGIRRAGAGRSRPFLSGQPAHQHHLYADG